MSLTLMTRQLHKLESHPGLLIDRIISWRFEGREDSELSEILGYETELKELFLELSEGMESPYREYLKILSLAGNMPYVRKDDRRTFLSLYFGLDTRSLREMERLRVHGIGLSTLYNLHDYARAEIVAGKLLDAEELPVQCLVSLADYLIRTRRYEKAEGILLAAMEDFDDAGLDRCALDLAKRTEGRQYLPASSEDKVKYRSFMKAIGMDLDAVPKPRRIPGILEEETDDSFESFIAYDFETTGLSLKRDEIIEIGAVKVRDGEIIDTFQSFVRPEEKRVSEYITNLTGISWEDVKEAPLIGEILPEFMAWTEGLTMLGYHSMGFDYKFLRSAARKAAMTIDNPQFDVLHQAKEKLSKEQFTEGHSLGKVSSYLEIENPRAHRALADAETTAKVFLKLKQY